MNRRVRVEGDLYHGQIPDGAVYVGRPAPGLRAGPFANRHRFGKVCRCGATHRDRAEAVAAYAAELTPELVARAREELAGFDLACWCPLDGPCHGDLLVLLAAGDDLDTAFTRLGWS
ncbi:DUF4326 domain-containing protein [Actinoplanes sp. NPDC023714]|uniref:DUF4326 domain-containing protein n=1 Tax=Actinoplanes sp. NPDC023714 TaxID=3154322 RepID=UPI00340E3D27